MRVTPDTNVVVSGLLWQGRPREILDAARAGRITLFTTPILLAELQDVIELPRQHRIDPVDLDQHQRLRRRRKPEMKRLLHQPGFVEELIALQDALSIARDHLRFTRHRGGPDLAGLARP